MNIPKLAAAQEAIERLHVGGLLGLQPLPVAPAEVERQGGDDLAGHVVLHRKDVGEVAIEALRPEMAVIGGVDELGSDPNPIAGFANASLEHISDAERLADLLDGNGPALEREGGIAGDDEELRKLRQVP